MDLWSLVQIMFRRWWVVVPLLALTAWCTIALTDSIPPEYEVDGAILLVGPGVDDELADEVGTNNRLLQLSGSLGTVAEALGLTLQSQATRAEFDQRGLIPEYVVGVDSRSPIMQFLVAGEDPDAIVATMDALMTEAEAQLTLRQDELDTSTEDRIEIQRISSDNEPTPGFGSRRRAQILLAAVGVVVTLASAIAVDALLYFGRRRRQRRAEEPTGGPDLDDDRSDGAELSLFDETLLAELTDEQTRGDRPTEVTTTVPPEPPRRGDDRDAVRRRLSEPVGGPERTS